MLNKDIFNSTKPLENLANQILYTFISKGIPFALPSEYSTFINDGYAGNVNIYPIIRKIVNPVMGVKWSVKDENDEDVQQSDLMALLSQPNPMQGKYEFIDEALCWRLVTGNRYIYIMSADTGANKGKPAELHLLPASEVEIIQGVWLQPVQSYHLRIGNTYKTIAADKVIHGKTTNLQYNLEGSQLYGMSPLQSALKVMTATNMGYARMQKNFENGGPDYIITGTKETAGGAEYTEEQKQSIWDWLKSSKWKRERFHVKNLPIEVHALGQSMVDLNVLAFMKLSLRDYCNIYGVPSALMNDNEYATQSANAREYQRQLWNNAIIPELEMLKEDLNKVAKMSNKVTGLQHYFDYDLSDIPELQTDMAIQAGGLAQAWWLTGNDRLAAQGLPASDDPAMDIRFMPMGLVPIDDLLEPMDEEPTKYLDQRGIKY